MPDKESEQVKLTVTFVLFHPFAFATGKAAPLMEGGVESMLMDAVFAEPAAAPVLPTPSVAVQVIA